MEIAIIDYHWGESGEDRWLRSEDLSQYLFGCYNNYNVKIFPHVNFKDFVAPTCSMESIRAGAEPYMVIVLHVGGGQLLAVESLIDAFKDKYVVCFTGSHIPPNCENDCLKNPKHCYIKDSIGGDDSWPALWKTKILECLRLLEQGQPEEARNLIMGFNPKLENALDELQKSLRKLIQSGEASNEQAIDNLTKVRDEQLQNVYQ